MLTPLQKIYTLTGKSVAESSFRSFHLAEHIEMCMSESDESECLDLSCKAPPRTVQLFFCLKGELEFVFSGGHYRRTLAEGAAFVMYQPNRELAAQVIIPNGGRMIGLAISVKALHELFIREEQPLSFLQGEQIDQKYYSEIPISPQAGLVLGQLMNQQHLPLHFHVYYHGKALELLSVVFDRKKDQDLESCPFLLDANNVKRIRQAKRIILDNMLNPPSLKELARGVGLNVYQLKVGFKNIYGASVFQYLNDAKMEQARQKLDTMTFKVNEVSDALGYSSSSHFIAAFKRKFGITPKKYLMALQQGHQPERQI
ncbi:MAG: AraC family transcriptional regulator [Bacteroidota bacterium]